ncbi:MAG: DUF5054 domain-containing protein [Hyphomicrobiaceae bacterium]|nr:DUF5054 domain-containing protein [Hyphomicrobiaceae bacterium]
MPGTTIHLVFKTHLDIGFTNHAEKVRQQYHAHYIPQALDTAEHFHFEDPANPKFVWTTGAWLIADYLDCAAPENVRRLERAIDLGLIRWHALPFTTHSELMSPALFRAGLSYSQELDQRFGRKTVAAKMTDVPGHTRGIVPLLAEAGVKFLHLGVNEASPVPDVPDIFRWRADTGEEIVVMYQDSYGATHFPEGSDQGLSFAHTNDNLGPQGISQTVDAYRHLAAEHPGANVRASSLDAFGDILWQMRESFPVLNLEIGDSWIHGAGTDPAKVSRFLALQRVYDRFAAESLTPSRRAFGRGLAMVPEHTWGVDIKTFLRDETAWDRADFEKMRSTDPRFDYAEQSWTEQRTYLDTALAQLNAEDRVTALAEADGPAPMPLSGEAVDAGSVIAVGCWSLTVDAASGDIASLTAPRGCRLEGAGGSLMGFRYESYDANDVAAHLDTYLTRRPEWAILDHAKPGLDKARTARSADWSPQFARAVRSEDAVSVTARFDEVAHAELGAPESVEIVVRPIDEATLELTLIARGKPANRMPEASFLTFTPQSANGWRFRKMGLWQGTDRIARRGGGQLQAVEAVEAACNSAMITVVPLDTPLVAPCGTPFMRYEAERPDFSSGIRFNLHNNKWGTNFPMWWGGDLVARFRLSL